MSQYLGPAIKQVQVIAKMCDFLDHEATQKALAAIPVTMPNDYGALGFSEQHWLGLGIVGIWAALDAYKTRAQIGAATCPGCGTKCALSAYTASGKLSNATRDALYELEDLRNLFAHNFAGIADAEYFQHKKPRHVLQAAAIRPLSSGAQFDGQKVGMSRDSLRFYARHAEDALRAVTV
jgi:hypothetical protein